MQAKFKYLFYQSLQDRPGTLYDCKYSCESKSFSFLQKYFETIIGRIFIKSLKLWKVHIISLIDNNLMNQWMMQPSLVTAKPRKYRKCMQYGDFLHRGIGEDSVHLKVFNMYAQQL